MEVEVIEKKAWESIQLKLKESLAQTQDFLNKINNPDKDRLMTVDEACKYVGFKAEWLRERIEVSKYGKYLKSNIDKYMEANSFKK